MSTYVFYRILSRHVTSLRAIRKTQNNVTPLTMSEHRPLKEEEPQDTAALLEEEQAGEMHKEQSDQSSSSGDDAPRQTKKIHKLSLTKTTDFNEKLKKRGVIYVARVPPRMNPSKIKSLLSDFGVVTRVYLVEEDAARRKRRRKATGNGTKRYMEGWVEFENKGIAKHVALSLNNTPISMHKRNVHYGTCIKVTVSLTQIKTNVPLYFVR